MFLSLVLSLTSPSAGAAYVAAGGEDAEGRDSVVADGSAGGTGAVEAGLGVAGTFGALFSARLGCLLPDDFSSATVTVETVV